MRQKNLWAGLAGCAGMLVLILDGKTALSGMKEGILLCLSAVIPALFPFFILSILVVNVFSGASIPLLRPLGWLCGIPSGAESILIPGFLGGYPVGAQAIAHAYHTGTLDRADAERMLGYCSNAGPAFLFGMVAPMFPKLWMGWALWAIHIASAVFSSWVLPKAASHSVRLSGSAPVPISRIMASAVETMAAVCGWVVLFRVLIAFLNRWFLWLFPAEIQVVINGALELTNGCCALPSIAEVSLRFVLCAGMLAFGGLSVTMQTISVIQELNPKYYFLGKALQTLFSLLLAAAVVYGIPFLLAVIFLLFVVLLEKSSSIPEGAGV